MNPTSHKKQPVNTLFRKIMTFERKNPAIVRAMKLLDMSMKEYSQAMNNLDPTTTYTGNSTTVLTK